MQYNNFFNTFPRKVDNSNSHQFKCSYSRLSKRQESKQIWLSKTDWLSIFHFTSSCFLLLSDNERNVENDHSSLSPESTRSRLRP